MAKYEQLIPDFIEFVKVNTRSDANSSTIPSANRETAFLNHLQTKLTQMGLKDVHTNEQSGYVFATLPANIDYSTPVVGFISHIDTADFNSENIQPQFVKNYDGESVIKLDKAGKYNLDPTIFPNLRNYKGDTLITSDGTTLLGADDKSGVAEIIAAVNYLMNHPEIKHGELKLGFGPDEEIGTGADHFDVKDFGADVAYTVDGGPEGDLNYETFNAADAKIKVQGTNVHPSDAKGVMVNAVQVAMDFHNQLPAADRPEKTDNRQGFFHVYAFNGTVDASEIDYIIRDHDREKFEARKQLVKDIVNQLNQQYGANTVSLDMHDEYYNMGEVVASNPEVVDIAEQAMKNVGVKPNIFAVRGGTDGSKISFMGLPTPNIFAGGENMHGRFEFVSERVMEKATDVIVEIAKLYAAK